MNSIEPRVSAADKELLVYCAKRIRRILSQYPNANGFSSSITKMEQCKMAALDLAAKIERLEEEK